MAGSKILMSALFSFLLKKQQERRTKKASCSGVRELYHENLYGVFQVEVTFYTKTETA